MKKTKLIGLAALLLTLGVVGCGESGEEVPACEHQFTTWKTTKATCKTAGQKVRTCKICSYEEKEELAIDTENGHSWKDDGTVNKAATCTQKGVTGAKLCELCGAKKAGTTVNEVAHQYAPAEDATHGKQIATCAVEGFHYEKCSECQAWSEKITDVTTDHTWGDESTLNAASPIVKKASCTVNNCKAVKVSVNALSGTITGGSNKSAGSDNLADTLKLGATGAKATYTFNFEGTLTGKIYFLARMDHWSSNSGCTFYSGKEGGTSLKECENPNFELKINDAVVDVSSKKTVTCAQVCGAEEDPDHSTFSKEGMFEVGTAALKNGSNTFSFERLDSYNLLIREFVFIGSYVA